MKPKDDAGRGCAESVAREELMEAGRVNVTACRGRRKAQVQNTDTHTLDSQTLPFTQNLEKLMWIKAELV